MKHCKKAEKKKIKPGKIVLRAALFVVTFVVIIGVSLKITLSVLCSKPDAKKTFITTVLETGQMKFLAGLSLSKDEINEIVNSNSMEAMSDVEVDDNEIDIKAAELDPEYAARPAIEVKEITNESFKATLMIIKDPSTVSVATIIGDNGKWPAYGVTLKEIADENNAVAAVNAGLYSSTNNSGGYPFGVVVSDGKIVRNYPQEWPGLVFVGLTNDNILQIIDISKVSASEMEKMVKERGIRDGVCFQEEATGDNNHFVYLVTNGKAREVIGDGSGLNPRTAIGQRKDGSILLLVTDGRGYNGHIGASAADLIDIMVNNGAVNAANLDGGSSTCMYYKGEYLQDSVTFYYSQTSWRLPFAFIVSKEDE